MLVNFAGVHQVKVRFCNFTDLLDFQVLIKIGNRGEKNKPDLTQIRELMPKVAFYQDRVEREQKLLRTYNSLDLHTEFHVYWNNWPVSQILMAFWNTLRYGRHLKCR